MLSTLNRLDPSQLNATQIAQLQEVLGHSPSLVSADTPRVEIPEPILNLLRQMLDSLSHGDSLLLMPEEETLTSQEAADFLGVSRPFLTKLTDCGEIPFSRVGRHRRIRLRDLRHYVERRNHERRSLLKSAYDAIDEAGLYDQVPSDFHFDPE